MWLVRRVKVVFLCGALFLLAEGHTAVLQKCARAVPCGLLAQDSNVQGCDRVPSWWPHNEQLSLRLFVVSHWGVDTMYGMMCTEQSMGLRFF